MTLFYFYKYFLSVSSWANKSLIVNDLGNKSTVPERKPLSPESKEVSMKNKIETLGPFLFAKGTLNCPCLCWKLYLCTENVLQFCYLIASHTIILKSHQSETAVNIMIKTIIQVLYWTKRRENMIYLNINDFFVTSHVLVICFTKTEIFQNTETTRASLGSVVENRVYSSQFK